MLLNEMGSRGFGFDIPEQQGYYLQHTTLAAGLASPIPHNSITSFDDNGEIEKSLFICFNLLSQIR